LEGSGILELADYARPCFEKLLMLRRKEAVEAINKITSDIQDQYNKALKYSRKVATTGAFLNALNLQGRHNKEGNSFYGALSLEETRE